MMPARIRAFLLHLFGSAVVALLGVILIFGLWYPAPLHEAVGVTGIFFLLLAVDVLLGPLLTLVVYKVGKKSLVFDLTVIVCLQLAALLYGLSAVAEGRPAWLVFSVDRFDLIRGPDVDTRQIERAPEQFRTLPWLGPRWAAAMIPEDPAQHNAVVFEAIAGGADISQRPNLYQPLASAASTMRSKAHPLEELRRYNSAEAVAQARARWPQANAWLPLKASVKDQVVLLNKETATPVAIVDLAPW
jgi:hypothetical protein